MPDVLLLLPDLALIVCGYLICRYTPLDRSVWDGTERLVYYLLFPALLFNAIVRNPLNPGTALQFGGAGVAVVGTGIALAYALRAVPGVNAHLHASGAQTAFRFNSYVGLALAERLAGAQGLAWQALLVSLCVPLCNIAAVWPLARQGGHGYLRELARNPLILATGAGSGPQNDRGTAEIWGKLVATALGVYIIPGNYAFVQGLARRRAKQKAGPPVVAVPALPTPQQGH